jgi:hypothetical protein
MHIYGRKRQEKAAFPGWRVGKKLRKILPFGQSVRRSWVVVIAGGAPTAPAGAV